MSALSFSLRGESPTFSGLQLWLQGCAAFPHLLQETPPRKLFNPYFSASCAQAPPPPGSHPPLRLRRVGGPAPTPPQHSACTHSSAPVRLEAGRSRPHRALPLTPVARGPLSTTASHSRPGKEQAQTLTGGRGGKRAENTMGMEVGRQAGPTGQSSEGHFRGRRPSQGGGPPKRNGPPRRVKRLPSLEAAEPPSQSGGQIPALSLSGRAPGGFICVVSAGRGADPGGDAGPTPRGPGRRPYLRSSTSASRSSSSSSNCLVTKLSTGVEAMAAGRPGPRAAEVRLPRAALLPAGPGASTHQARTTSASALGGGCGKMAAAVAAWALPVTFGRLASACSRSVLRASGPGAGKARPAG